MHYALTDRQNFDTEFMAQNPRILDERHFALIAAEIGAADADRADRDENLAAPW
jgi:hypothetical protein